MEDARHLFWGLAPDALNSEALNLSGPDRTGLVLQERMEDARNLFRNAETTEFVIVTIPTVMAVAESARLAKALRTEGVPVNTIVINQASPRPSIATRKARPSRVNYTFSSPCRQFFEQERGFCGCS